MTPRRIRTKLASGRRMSISALLRQSASLGRRTSRRSRKRCGHGHPCKSELTLRSTSSKSRATGRSRRCRTRRKARRHRWRAATRTSPPVTCSSTTPPTPLPPPQWPPQARTVPPPPPPPLTWQRPTSRADSRAGRTWWCQRVSPRSRWTKGCVSLVSASPRTSGRPRRSPRGECTAAHGEVYRGSEAIAWSGSHTLYFFRGARTGLHIGV
mmetsp:Transcript_38017/g.76092  ORF Transcript_38017/g.76092 Transcript_38017/m.76092 type:complete len:211 (-) Transcript_38017:39-671(-)